EMEAGTTPVVERGSVRRLLSLFSWRSMRAGMAYTARVFLVPTIAARIFGAVVALGIVGSFAYFGGDTTLMFKLLASPSPTPPCPVGNPGLPAGVLRSASGPAGLARPPLSEPGGIRADRSAHPRHETKHLPRRDERHPPTAPRAPRLADRRGRCRAEMVAKHPR